MLMPSMVILVTAEGTRWKCDELQMVTPLTSRLSTCWIDMRLVPFTVVARPSIVPLPVIAISCPLPMLIRVLSGEAFQILVPLES